MGCRVGFRPLLTGEPIDQRDSECQLLLLLVIARTIRIHEHPRVVDDRVNDVSGNCRSLVPSEPQGWVYPQGASTINVLGCKENKHSKIQKLKLQESSSKKLKKDPLQKLKATEVLRPVLNSSDRGAFRTVEFFVKIRARIFFISVVVYTTMLRPIFESKKKKPFLVEAQRGVLRILPEPCVEPYRVF